MSESTDNISGNEMHGSGKTVEQERDQESISSRVEQMYIELNEIFKNAKEESWSGQRPEVVSSKKLSSGRLQIRHFEPTKTKESMSPEYESVVYSAVHEDKKGEVTGYKFISKGPAGSEESELELHVSELSNSDNTVNRDIRISKFMGSIPLALNHINFSGPYSQRRAEMKQRDSMAYHELREESGIEHPATIGDVEKFGDLIEELRLSRLKS